MNVIKPIHVHRSRGRKAKTRRKRIDQINKIVFVSGIFISGCAGILLGAIVINILWPGHPVYIEIKSWLHSIFR